MSKRIHVFFVAVFSAVFLWASEDVAPLDLKAWKAWVLHDVKDANSPQHYLAQSWNRQRVWPSFLHLTKMDQTLNFEMELALFDAALVELPGDRESWPLDLRVNGKLAQLIDQNNRPCLALEAGRFGITGKFVWDKAPSKIFIPPCCGVVTLMVDGKVIGQPNLDREGWLWFKKSDPEPKGEQDLAEIKVFRKIVDDQPMLVDTLMLLGVSGRERVVEVGRFNLPFAEVMELNSPLSARVEASGNLKIQLRSGQYRIQMQSRLLKSCDNLTWQAQSREWPESEIWSFEARRDLRQVQLKGATPIDPSQQEIPEPWKQLPSFLVGAGESLQFIEVARGENSMDKNSLSMVRELWLDFDGTGMTSMDAIKGRMVKDWRLNSGEDFQLGSVQVDAQPRLVSLSREGLRGVELRNQNINILAYGRKDMASTTMSASGWHHDLNQLSITLHLPYAWELLFVRGSDTATGSWLERWNLLDVFLVLLITVGMGKLLGFFWGGLALIYLVLAFHSEEAPKVIWFNFLLTLALLKVLPEVFWRRFFRNYVGVAFVVLAFLTLSYGGQEIREVIYPQLEQREDIYSPREEKTIITSFEERHEAKDSETWANSPLGRGLSSSGPTLRKQAVQKIKKDRMEAVQTGPGQPQWKGKTYHIGWNGPVLQGETFSLVLLPPVWWKIVRCLRVLLLLLLCWGLLRQMGRLSSPRKSWSSIPSGVVGGLALFFISSGECSAEFPSHELLQTYKERLTSLPQHSLASVNGGNCVFSEKTITVHLNVDAQQLCYIPLLEKNSSWTLRNILIEGKKAEAVRCNDAQQWEVALAPGSSIVTLVLDDIKDYVQIVFPVAIHNFQVLSHEWSVRGLHQGFIVPNGSLQLERKSRLDIATAKDNLLSDPVVPFVEILRQLHLGYDWTVTTRVTRLAPKSEALHLQIPTLEGEKLLDGDLKLVKGLYQVDFARDQLSVEWTSLLEKVDLLQLTCGANPSLREQWEIHPSPLWRIAHKGIPAIKTENGQMSFRPRLGETVQLQVSEAKGAQGQLKTIENVNINIDSGPKASKVTLNVSIKSSLGGAEQIKLPETFELESMTRNNLAQYSAISNGVLSLPLAPGASNFEVKLICKTPETSFWKSPAVEFETPLNNIHIVLKSSQDRWVLALGGPSSGPAVLFWGMLVMMIFIAQILPWGFRALGLEMPLGRWQWTLLFAGFSTVTPWVNLVFLAWFGLLAWRKQHSDCSPRIFNLLQVACLAESILVSLAMVASIPYSLLGTPQMMIEGIGCWEHHFQWFQDRSTVMMPTAWMVSCPLWVYRLGMLLWSLWLAFAVFNWMKWAWSCFSYNGRWKSRVDPLKNI